MDDQRNPTYRRALRRELIAKGHSCRDCQHNIEERGKRKCEHGCRAWPDGPCYWWDKLDIWGKITG